MRVTLMLAAYLVAMIFCVSSQALPTEVGSFENEEDLPRWRPVEVNEWVPRLGRFKRKPPYIMGGIRY
ncbi:hypothetical protein FGIG_11491 [Fasciola gigantica]|uniref:Uncharacterized protein n=1 Tax=Fasciola gigantica TaxID=46835 RepID=A0A504YDJ8_FASGI|nr:hypothetical protein FGIG_11491 [Fasciola gigantica]